MLHGCLGAWFANCSTPQHASLMSHRLPPPAQQPTGPHHALRAGHAPQHLRQLLAVAAVVVVRRVVAGPDHRGAPAQELGLLLSLPRQHPLLRGRQRGWAGQAKGEVLGLCIMREVGEVGAHVGQPAEHAERGAGQVAQCQHTSRPTGRKLQAHLRLPVHALQAIVHMVPQHAAVGKQRGAHLGGGQGRREGGTLQQASNVGEVGRRLASGFWLLLDLDKRAIMTAIIPRMSSGMSGRRSHPAPLACSTTGFGAKKRRVTSPPGSSAAVRAPASGRSGCVWWPWVCCSRAREGSRAA